MRASVRCRGPVRLTPSCVVPVASGMKSAQNSRWLAGLSSMQAGVSRRQLLQVGGIGLWGLSLPTLLRAETQPVETSTRALADSCILVVLNGGPSHLDMWDMKPDAPAEVRGEFRPIATSVPGVRLCEHLPRLARL